ncbi:hypothetical protein GDO78_010635 [Eleutherodactylus coqui]|uniref:Uncharacterized protein n=1 Tax=Eleutherodactylus coqui TaxID=57060 RepID=A0A8J6F5K4_ELECQ|nr:hypothetical protein GDO78_010635 [Eleutherodactylus coqui]
MEVQAVAKRNLIYLLQQMEATKCGLSYLRLVSQNPQLCRPLIQSANVHFYYLPTFPSQWELAGYTEALLFCGSSPCVRRK